MCASAASPAEVPDSSLGWLGFPASPRAGDLPKQQRRPWQVGHPSGRVEGRSGDVLHAILLTPVAPVAEVNCTPLSIMTMEGTP